MRIQFKPYAWVLALAVGTSIIGGATRTMGFPAMNAAGADQDYSKNSRYQQGQREGKDDKAHNRDHFRKRHFSRDEDNKAYESGYQNGHGADVHVDVR